jgi:hypothetical protein
MLPFLIAAAVAAGALAIFIAFRSANFAKFLAGAFFAASAIQFYLYAARVDLPVLGTDLVLSPQISALRGAVHGAFFLLMFYLGFLRRA